MEPPPVWVWLFRDCRIIRTYKRRSARGGWSSRSFLRQRFGAAGIARGTAEQRAERGGEGGAASSAARANSDGEARVFSRARTASAANHLLEPRPHLEKNTSHRCNITCVRACTYLHAYMRTSGSGHVHTKRKAVLPYARGDQQN